MSEIINFPQSMNLSQTKPQALNDMKGSFQQYKSQNQNYKQRDTISIPIPTGASGTFLHGSDSFISFRFTPEFIDPGTGALFLDGNFLSLFKNVRIRHGSSLLCNHREANRLYQSLFDSHTTSATRAGRSIDLGIFQNNTITKTQNMNGAYLGTTGKTLDCCVTLPIPLLGSLAEKALPVGWLTNSQLFLEIDLEDVNKIMTSRGSDTTIRGEIGSYTSTSGAPTLINYMVSEIYYHAKISKISPAYDNLLKNAIGPIVSIASQDYIGDSKQIGTGTTSINENFSLPLISAKSFFFWLTNNKSANGTVYAFNYNNAITQRMSGDLKEYQLSLNGENYPSTAISCDHGGNSQEADHINGSIALQQLYRCWDLNSSASGIGIFEYDTFCDTETSQGSDIYTKRFIGAVDMDRGDCSNSRQLQGTNTVDSTIGLKAVFNTPLADACNLYAYMLHDCVFTITDGMMDVRR
jgi:hypothetical protein